MPLTIQKTLSRKRLCMLCIAVFGLLSSFLVSAADVPDNNETSERARCLDLADLVADSCPNACTNRHCATRCIPPFNESARCGRCQENCLRICGAMSQARQAECETPANSSLLAPPTDLHAWAG